VKAETNFHEVVRSSIWLISYSESFAIRIISLQDPRYRSSEARSVHVTLLDPISQDAIKGTPERLLEERRASFCWPVDVHNQQLLILSELCTTINWYFQRIASLNLYEEYLDMAAFKTSVLLPIKCW